MTSSLIQFIWNFNRNRPRVYISNIPNFILIKHKRVERQGREVNKELWRKNGYYVTVTFTFDPRYVTNFNRNWASIHLAKTGILFTNRVGHTDTHTDTHTQKHCNENITPPRFRGDVKRERPDFSVFFHSLFLFCSHSSSFSVLISTVRSTSFSETSHRNSKVKSIFLIFYDSWSQFPLKANRPTPSRACVVVHPLSLEEQVEGTITCFSRIFLLNRLVCTV